MLYYKQYSSLNILILKIMKTIKGLIKELLFLLGMVLCIWPLIVLIKENFSFIGGEAVNRFSFGLLKLQIFEGNGQLVIIFFIAVIVLGVFTMFLSKR